MAIPVISDIFNAVKALIDWLVRTIPRPVLFMIFIFALTLIGGLVLPLVFMLGGTFCAEGVQYQNDQFNPIENSNFIYKWFQRADSSGETQEVDKDISAPGVLRCSEEYTNGTDSYFSYKGVFCTGCEEITAGHPLAGWAVIAGINYSNVDNGYCVGDAYRLPRANLSWYKRVQCGGEGQTFIGLTCRPPQNYFYNQSLNKYQCLIGNCTQAASEAFAREVAGTFQRTPVSPEQELVGVSCDEDTPVFKAFNVAVFDYRLWYIIFLLIIVIYIYRAAFRRM